MTIKFSQAAQESIKETGIDPAEDIAAIRSGKLTEEGLLARCLDGADEDRAEGWNEYVATVVSAAAQAVSLEDVAAILLPDAAPRARLGLLDPGERESILEAIKINRAATAQEIADEIEAGRQATAE
jgi:hypothetical protein